MVRTEHLVGLVELSDIIGVLYIILTIKSAVSFFIRIVRIMSLLVFFKVGQKDKECLNY